MGKQPTMLEGLLKAHAKEVRKGTPRKKSPLPPSQQFYRCATAECGEVSPSYAAAERHADQAKHRRIECVMDPGSLKQ